MLIQPIEDEENYLNNWRTQIKLTPPVRLNLGLTTYSRCCKHCDRLFFTTCYTQKSCGDCHPYNQGKKKK